MLRIAAAAMLLTGFYVDMQPKRVVVQCVRLGSTCQRDLGYIDSEGRFHPVNKEAGHAIR
jgi:hypothetical protein